MTQPARGGGLVTVDVWDLPARRVPQAVARLALDRRRLRATPGVTFAKLLGTGDGRTFRARDATPRRWAALTCWDGDPAAAPVLGAWDRLAERRWRLLLRPVAARGRWSRREPFGDPVPVPHAGPVAALTRARLRLRLAPLFYRSVPPVSAALGDASGLRWAMAVGEAPLGLQGTLSLWDSAAELRRYAYSGAAHRRAVEQTRDLGWYAEEMFARFAVLDVTGDGPLPGARVGSVGGAVSP